MRKYVTFEIRGRYVRTDHFLQFPEKLLKFLSHRERVVCAITRDVRKHALTSSGTIYEKRLIEAYISENGTEPATGEGLTIEDLIDIRTSRTVRPRPPTLTSIPSLLGVFQEEWDALALETYTLKQNLAQTRQELSTALYQHDAAVRVIARLTRERNEAREALSKVSIGSSTAPTNGDAMQVDSRGLSDELVVRVDETKARYVGFDGARMSTY